MIIARKIPNFTKKVSDLPDRPGGTISTVDLKYQFDSSPEELRSSLNGLIDDLLSAVAGLSGAEQVGSAPIVGVSGVTIYDQLSDLKAQIQSIVGASIPAGSITTAMIQNLAVTTAKLIDASVTFQKLSTDMQAASVGGQLYAYRNSKGGF